MRIQSVIVHDVNPGSSPEHLREQTQTLPLSEARIGIELDVTMKRPPGSKGHQPHIPVAISRDGALRVELGEHVKAFAEKGFEGPYLLDVTNRRATTPILQNLAHLPHDQVFIQMPAMAIGYKTPWGANNNLFKVEMFWRDAWDRLTVSSRHPDIAREFSNHGAKLNLFWVPIEDDQYRKDRLDLVRNADVIIYKMPHLTHSALFDPNRCMNRDLDLFNSVAKDILVVPMGSVELFREHRKTLFSEDSGNDMLKGAGLVPNEEPRTLRLDSRASA
jgi:hypothetical protein